MKRLDSRERQILSANIDKAMLAKFKSQVAAHGFKSVSEAVESLMSAKLEEWNGHVDESGKVIRLDERLRELEGQAHALYVESLKQEKMLRDDRCFDKFTDDFVELIKPIDRVDHVDQLIGGGPSWADFDEITARFRRKYMNTEKAGQAAVFVRYLKKLKERKIIENQIDELTPGRPLKTEIEGQNKELPSSREDLKEEEERKRKEEEETERLIAQENAEEENEEDGEEDVTYVTDGTDGKGQEDEDETEDVVTDPVPMEKEEEDSEEDAELVPKTPELSPCHDLVPVKVSVNDG